MPKIEVYEDALSAYIGRRFSSEELEDLLPAAKAELDGRDESGKILKIELNDTNRPDLWSTAGLGRQLRLSLGGKIPSYDFFSLPGRLKDAGERRVVVDPSVLPFRPYITAFAVTGKPVDEPMLKDLIQTQEKLCWNYGRKRKSIAMGVYRSDIMAWPVRYRAADPDATKFVPLGMDRELSLREILNEHPTGREYGWIVADLPQFPYLEDAGGQTLSFPPVINSDHLGAVRVGDSELFIELTGTDLPSLLLTASIVACDMADAGYTILPVKVEYPEPTPHGKDLVMPFYFQEPVRLELSYAAKLLGESFTAGEAAGYLARMGCRCETDGESVTVRPPEYRNDFLHPVDVIEDLMIGRGTESFSPVPPTDFTVGRLTPMEHFSRRVKSTMVGLGYQEMIFNYLGSGKDYIERMRIPADRVIRISNPMSENYEYLRNSILPSLLGAESISGNAAYPHLVFEVGKIAFPDPAENYGTRTVNSLGFLASGADANFNLASSHAAALFYFLSLEYSLAAAEDPRFIPGRVAEIRCGDRSVGVFGEIHPEVLEAWGIQMPCAACEIDLDRLLSD